MYVIVKWILVIDGWGISCEIDLNVTGLHWWSVNNVDPDLSQYGITRPQWVESAWKLYTFFFQIQSYYFWHKFCEINIHS